MPYSKILIRMTLKKLARRNALAYFVATAVTKKKSFIRLTFVKIRSLFLAGTATFGRKTNWPNDIWLKNKLAK
jgi:hypothetical protein